MANERRAATGFLLLEKYRQVTGEQDTPKEDIIDAVCALMHHGELVGVSHEEVARIAGMHVGAEVPCKTPAEPPELSCPDCGFPVEKLDSGRTYRYWCDNCDWEGDNPNGGQ